LGAGFFLAQPSAGSFYLWGRVEISLESYLAWIKVMRQLVAMQTEVTRAKVHAVGRGKQ
jgi:hypothetical protein